MTALAIVSTARNERSEFEELRDRWTVSRAGLNRLLSNRDDMLIALNLATVDTPPHPDSVGLIARAAPHPDSVGLIERAARYIERARRHPKRLLDDIDDLNDEIDMAKSEHAVLEGAWQSACQFETNRLAQPLVPRHRDAVRRMAVALQDLSVALADESAVRRDLASIAPMSESALLPNMGMTLNGLRQSDPNSLGSKWAAIARKLGLLND